MKEKQQRCDLMTEEGEKLTRMPWQEYPRPQLRRDSFFCLNGMWHFWANGGAEESIRVPFAPESRLSGIHRRMGKRPELKYEKRFVLPQGFVKQRVLLHFGAVDQIARVVLNGTLLGEHYGGYTHFSFDVTDALREENVLTVYVTDALADRVLPYGKQKEKRGGMWYTPISGIWQTVWMESVSESYVRSLQIDCDAEGVTVTAEGVCEGEITVQTPTGALRVPLKNGVARICPDPIRLWSPEDPYLYHFELVAGEDRVKSYFALRTLDIREVGGVMRLCLNGKPYFFHGVLDQGYYSDGIYTPASPDGYSRDILAMKRMGFNTLRKHIKLEPDCFYYACDRLGMVVFQDMVNNGRYSFLRDTALPTLFLKKLPDRLLHRNARHRAAFLKGIEETVAQLKHYPAICLWTVFNEGWGQFCGSEAYERLREMDDSRFIDTASGWFGGVKSDVESIHVYFKPVRIRRSPRPLLLSEFGGYAHSVPCHVFHTEKEYGYRKYADREALEEAVLSLYEKEILPAIPQGLCGAIYTQLSDVEDETNGLLTYDRRIEKINAHRMADLGAHLQAAMEETK